MCSSHSSVQMDEVRRRAQSILSISGSAQDVKTEVQTIANIPLPLSEKYQHLEVENILRENTEGNNSQEVQVNSDVFCWSKYIVNGSFSSGRFQLDVE